VRLVRGMARVLLWQLIARCSSALIISPVSRGAHHHARSLTIMMSSPEDRLTALEESLKALRQEKGMEVDDGDAPVDRLAALENDLLQLRKDMGAPSAETAIDTDVPPVNMPPAPSFPPFPSTNTLGVEGVRCAILFYAFDGIPKAEILLEAFEDEAAEFSACGCALVGVRRSAQDAGDERKAREYEERFPTFNFVGGLESLSDDARAAAGIGADWARSLYYDPVCVLLDDDGGMRTVLSHQGLSAANVLGNVMRDLHAAVPRGAEATISAAEAEANRQALHNENVAWAEALAEDESLRQPTRFWFDFTPRDDDKALLAGADMAALPMVDGTDAPEPVPELVDQNGRKAPEWYARAKASAERRQEAEKLLWNGTAPSAAAGPLPWGPAGARLAPTQQLLDSAAKDAASSPQVRAFFAQFGAEDTLRTFLVGGDDDDSSGVARSASDGTLEGDVVGDTPAAREATASALLRAQMLALGLSRSASGGGSSRRLRLVRELDKSVRELEAEGFRGNEQLAALKAQLKESYAVAPAEFVDEMRKADPFNTALPPLTPAEIAAEFAAMAEAGASKIADSLARSAVTPDFDSLNPGRKRAPREKGNKIEIKKPAE